MQRFVSGIRTFCGAGGAGLRLLRLKEAEVVAFADGSEAVFRLKVEKFPLP